MKLRGKIYSWNFYKCWLWGVLSPNKDWFYTLQGQTVPCLTLAVHRPFLAQSSYLLVSVSVLPDLNNGGFGANQRELIALSPHTQEALLSSRPRRRKIKAMSAPKRDKDMFIGLFPNSGFQVTWIFINSVSFTWPPGQAFNMGNSEYEFSEIFWFVNQSKHNFK